MANCYQSLDQKPYESRYLYAETVIDRSVETVWPHVLHIGTWMSDHRLETIAGEPGGVGHFERVFPHDISSTVPQPHYHLYGVAEIIPLKYIALEIFPAKGGSYGVTRPSMGFDNIVVTDMGSSTKVTCIVIDVSPRVEEKSDISEVNSQREKDARTLHRLNHYFDNLRRLVSAVSNV